MIFIRLARSAALATLLWLPIISLPASAQSVPPIPHAGTALSGEFCGYGAAAAEMAFQQRLVGTWRTRHHTGFVFTPQTGMMAFPPSPPDPITLYMIDNTLLASAADGVQNVPLLPYARRTWSFRDQFPAEVIGNNPEPLLFDDVALMAGCADINELPRFLASTFIDQQGLRMRFTLRLIVLSEDVMHGILIVDGAVDGATISGGAARAGLVGFTSWRSVTMTRS